MNHCLHPDEVSPLFPLGFLLHPVIEATCQEWSSRRKLDLRTCRHRHQPDWPPPPNSSYENLLVWSTILGVSAKSCQYLLANSYQGYINKIFYSYFASFQQIVSPVNPEGLFSATWMGSRLFYMLSEYLLSKWMDMCLDDCLSISLLLS